MNELPRLQACGVRVESKAEIRQLQEKLFELTGSQKCLKNWSPHLTVGDGISVSEEKLAVVEKDLQTLANSQDKFEVSLSDFGGVTNRKGGEGEATTPYVLWVDVEVTKNLKSLVEKVEEKLLLSMIYGTKCPSHTIRM